MESERLISGADWVLRRLSVQALSSSVPRPAAADPSAFVDASVFNPGYRFTLAPVNQCAMCARRASANVYGELTTWPLRMQV